MVAVRLCEVRGQKMPFSSHHLDKVNQHYPNLLLALFTLRNITGKALL